MPRERRLENQARQALRTTGRLSDGEDKRGESELTDLDGVGPSTAKKLRRAEITDPVELEDVSTESLAAVEGIGRVRAEKIKTQVEFSTPGDDKISKPLLDKTADEHRVTGYAFPQNRKTDLTAEAESDPDESSREVRTYGADMSVSPSPGSVGVEGQDKQEAISEMADRSPAERRTDRRFNAPITLDVEYWKENKDQVDYPGVDTIPRSVARDRAVSKLGRAEKKDTILSIDDTDTSGSSFNRATRRLEIGDSGAERPEGVLAHELGHAVDEEITDRGDDPRSESIFSDEGRQQADRLVERRRGADAESVERQYAVNPFDGIEEGAFADVDTTYDFDQERFADVFASMTVEPRAAKREAPQAVREIKDELSGSGFLPGSPF